MVNQIIYDYIRNYYGIYRIEDIKTKILSSGYSENDFNEALAALGVSLEENVPRRESKKIKWIKISWIIGIIIFILCLVLLVYFISFNQVNEMIKNNAFFDMTKTNGKIFYSVLFVVLAVLLSFFYYGFFNIGKYMDSKLIKGSSLILIILIILGFALATTNVIQKGPIRKGITVIDENNPNPQPSAMDLIKTNLIAIILGSLILTMFILFFIGLFLVRYYSTPAFISSILGLIFILCFTMLAVSIIFVPELRGNLINSRIEFKFLLIPIGFSLLLALIILLKVFTLFKLSRQLE